MREYAEWLVDAKRANGISVDLIEELRTRWPEWREFSPYSTWEECCREELGVSASAIRKRRSRANGDLGPQDKSHAAQDPEPRLRSKVDDPPEVTERIARAVELAAEGHSYRQIGPMVGLDESIVRRDPDVRAARVAADPEAHSVTLRTNPMVCRIESAGELIAKVKTTLDEVLSEGYILSTKDKDRLRRILSGALERLRGQRLEG